MSCCVCCTGKNTRSYVSMRMQMGQTIALKRSPLSRPAPPPLPFSSQPFFLPAYSSHFPVTGCGYCFAWRHAAGVSVCPVYSHVFRSCCPLASRFKLINHSVGGFICCATHLRYFVTFFVIFVIVLCTDTQSILIHF